MTLELALDALTAIFLIIGSLFMIIGGIGMSRLPDVFARMHAAGIIDTMGLELIIIGLMFQSGFSIVTLKLFLILVFVFFTSPTTTHALARACLHGGLAPQSDDADSAAVSRTPVTSTPDQGGSSSKT